MTNRIDGPGGPAGPPIQTRIEGAEPTEKTSFQQALEAVEGAPSLEVQDLDRAVASVIEQVRRGELSDPVAITDRVIDRLVDHHFGHLGSDVSESMAESIRGALGHDPYFTMEVETLIALALERPSA